MPVVNLGVVIIGKNEGERLVRCIQSLQAYIPYSVYVDSASIDGSIEAAKKLGLHALALDMSKPFTAARARNAGFAELIRLHPNIELVQFVDGDCEVLDGWLKVSSDFLQKNSSVAVVSGILNERFPLRTIYNKLCDLEWKMPAGKVKTCGGNALMRVAAFKAANGFLDDIVAGEEPELCVRLRKLGWHIWHIHSPMMLHDADMATFGQWWKRTKRAGYAFAEGAYLHGNAPEFHWVAESKRSMRWGLYIPMAIILLLIAKPVFGMILLLTYPLQWLRLVIKSELPFRNAGLQAFFFIIGKFAEAIGQINFLWHRYKSKFI